MGGYKGFGLGLLLDILVAGLTGGLCPPAGPDAEGTNNVLLVVWDPSRFAGRSHFLSEADKLINYVRNSPRKAGVDAIRLPGDRANESHRERSKTGIPLDDGTWHALAKLAEKQGVAVPTL